MCDLAVKLRLFYCGVVVKEESSYVCVGGGGKNGEIELEFDFEMFSFPTVTWAIAHYLKLNKVSAIYLKCKDNFGEISNDESIFKICKGVVDGDTLDIYLEGEDKVDYVPTNNPFWPHVLISPKSINEGQLGKFAKKVGPSLETSLVVYERAVR